MIKRVARVVPTATAPVGYLDVFVTSDQIVLHDCGSGFFVALDPNGLLQLSGALDEARSLLALDHLTGSARCYRR